MKCGFDAGKVCGDDLKAGGYQVDVERGARCVEAISYRCLRM